MVTEVDPVLTEEGHVVTEADSEVTEISPVVAEVLCEYRRCKFKVPRPVLAQRLMIFWLNAAKVRKLMTEGNRGYAAELPQTEPRAKSPPAIRGRAFWDQFPPGPPLPWSQLPMMRMSPYPALFRAPPMLRAPPMRLPPPRLPLPAADAAPYPAMTEPPPEAPPPWVVDPSGGWRSGSPPPCKAPPQHVQPALAGSRCSESM